jgi:hypothetical protein
MAVTWPASIFNNKVLGEDEDGNAVPLRVNPDGTIAVRVAEGDITPITPHTWVRSDGLVAELGIKGSAGKLYDLTGSNEGTDKRYVMIFNSPTRPVNGTIPEDQGPVEGGTPFGFAYSSGRDFSGGMYVAVSTTAGTLTYDSAAQFFFSAEKF